MENPLTDELIEELNEIIQLPKEEQSLKLKEYFKKLNPEQLEFLKKHQTQQCIFCGIAIGQVNSYKIYEDDDIISVLDINPASKGHVLVIPKMHLKYTYEISPKIFEIVNLISKKIKEVLNCDSNIFIANGEEAGEKFEHVVVNIIPRHKDDGINFSWNFNKTSEKQLNEIANKLKIEVKKPEKIKENLRNIENLEYKKLKRIP